jgi:lysophospholipase L1-like esterase
MLERVDSKEGEFATESFTVNVRRPEFRGGGAVRLKPREKGVLHWDDKLTLEFNGERPCLTGLTIDPAPPDVVTVYLVGDSTVTDQPEEPWNSWGQMLTRFFGPGVAVANHAESGESLNSSLGAGRLDKVLSTIRKGDYLLIQFGHNDMKERGEGVGAFTTYKAALKRFASAARERGANPVFITPMHRRTFDVAGKVTNSNGDYPDAVRLAAREEDVPLIDLHSQSAILYEAMGREGTSRAFVDGTHHNAYGSYELARCVVEGVRKNVPGLARLLRDDFAPFDPSKPDDPATFSVPPSPQRSPTAREGS